MHTISALAVALKNAQSPEFKEYQHQVEYLYAFADVFQILSFTNRT